MRPLVTAITWRFERYRNPAESCLHPSLDIHASEVAYGSNATKSASVSARQLFSTADIGQLGGNRDLLVEVVFGQRAPFQSPLFS
jgi:hypothetical protein